jgi:hypothetical protein
VATSTPPERAVEDVMREQGGLDGPRAAKIAAWMRDQGWVR